MLQIEDLSQQVHKAAAEKFKVPSEPSALVPESAPRPRMRLECKEEEEEEEEEVRCRGSRTSWGLWEALHRGSAPGISSSSSHFPALPTLGGRGGAGTA